MKKFTNFLIVCSLLVGVIFIVYIGYIVFKAFLTIDPRITAALITSLLAVLGITIPKFLEKKMEIEQHLRDKKSDTYKELVTLIFQMLMGSKMGKPLNEKALIEKMSSLTENLILWGSPDVIKAYKAYRMGLVKREMNSKVTLTEIDVMEALLLAIRKDMGHKDKNLVRGDILSLFINDLEELLQDLETEEEHLQAQ
ncbi:hypothetical protein GFV16_00215 [Bacillus megaterium]|uniref:hypothetical protein n=1 Tax=Priestia megaterium TaxID=1404 RepID=UPI00129386AE|nr:hypothetical protein [Priestia megaterium]MQR84368.1 hypothetical protein [Priestia megaterium]